MMFCTVCMSQDSTSGQFDNDSEMETLYLANAIRSFYVYYIIRESLLKTCAKVQLNSVADDAFL